MYAPAYFRWIGVAIAKRAAISANDDDGAAAGPERRITPIGPRLGAGPVDSNPPYRLRRHRNFAEKSLARKN
jgi:hypothetical protein